MNSNLFERKNFLDGNWMAANISDYFSADTTNNNFVVKVNLSRATAGEADYFKKYLEKIPAENFSSLIFDLSECNFIDSTFLSSIIKFNKNTEAQIKLVVTDPRQMAIFKITKLDSLFNIYTNIDQALVA